MRRGGHRGRTDIAGSKVLSAAITPGRKCTDGFEPSRAVLQTAMITRSCAQMDSIRVERIPAVLQTAASTELAYCPDHPNGALGASGACSAPTGAERRSNPYLHLEKVATYSDE